MARADRKLIRLLDDEVCRDLLQLLLGDDGPQTQSELTKKLGLTSGAVSRRMSGLEDEGVVQRDSPRGPYDVVFREETRAMLIAAARLANRLAENHWAETKELLGELDEEALAGGRLHDRAREGA
jgi:DNA-binding Lrp family transcriptional regulator